MKGLNLDQLTQIGKLMDAVNHASDNQATTAFFFLHEIKQDMINRELYEELSDFKKLEELHECAVPFLYHGQKIEA